MAEERVTSLLMLIAVQPAAVHCIMHQSLMVQVAKALKLMLLKGAAGSGPARSSAMPAQ